MTKNRHFCYDYDMEQTLLIALAAILIGVRLPSFFRRQSMPKKDRILLTITVYVLLGLALLAVNGFSYIYNLFRMM